MTDEEASPPHNPDYKGVYLLINPQKARNKEKIKR
jgi:hypothetical protein